MVLRKHLRNARLTGVQQVGFDRVLAFSFDTKNGERTLYVEVFRDGNIILVDQEGVIVQPLTHASYAGRTLKKGVSYTPPPPAMDPYELDEQSLQQLLDESDRDLVSTLGGKVNLGATHANAVCTLAELNQTHRRKKPTPPPFTAHSIGCYRTWMEVRLAILFPTSRTKTTQLGERPLMQPQPVNNMHGWPNAVTHAHSLARPR